MLLFMQVQYLIVKSKVLKINYRLVYENAGKLMHRYAKGMFLLNPILQSSPLTCICVIKVLF